MNDEINEGKQTSKIIPVNAQITTSSISINQNIYSKIENIQNNFEYLSTKSIIDKYDNENIAIIKNTNSKELENILSHNISITANEYQNIHYKEIINEINNLKNSNIYEKLPVLPYGKRLSDLEFINLFKKCVKYANYKFDYEKLENTKRRLLELIDVIENVFKCPQILKDLKQNALLSILTSADDDEQTDNFNLLKVRYSSLTPLIKMNFNNNELNKKELTEIFCSYVYIKNYMKSLCKFIPNFNKIIPNETILKNYITNYFNNHDIYFCDMQDMDNIMAVTIHTGNMYLKAKYLVEYFEKNNPETQIIIREKIILNIAHELNHNLVREINQEMKNNFFIKSNYKGKKIENNEINFISKFDDTNIHILSVNESGNLFDYYFYDHYYFDDLYDKEAKLFLNIKEIKSLTEYKSKLNNIINEEKVKKPICNPVNKFKKLENKTRRCIKSRIIRVIKDSNASNFKLADEDDE